MTDLLEENQELKEQHKNFQEENQGLKEELKESKEENMSRININYQFFQ